MDNAPGPAQREPGRPRTVRELMRPAVTTVERHSHLAAAAYLMRNAGDSAVVVTADDASRRPIAIITEADITQAVADGKDVNEVRVDQMVGSDPVTTPSTATASEAAALMLSTGTRHLPVVDEGVLLGIIDIADACRALLDVSPLEAG